MVVKSKIIFFIVLHYQLCVSLQATSICAPAILSLSSSYTKEKTPQEFASTLIDGAQRHQEHGSCSLSAFYSPRFLTRLIYGVDWIGFNVNIYDGVALEYCHSWNRNYSLIHNRGFTSLCDAGGAAVDINHVVDKLAQYADQAENILLFADKRTDKDDRVSPFVASAAMRRRRAEACPRCKTAGRCFFKINSSGEADLSLIHI